MSSDRQIAANRRNATRSTGPRTETGKANSSRNALRHGLTTIADSAEKRAIAECLIRAIAGGNADDTVFRHAYRVAECHIEVQRADEAQTAAIKRLEMYFDNLEQKPPSGGPLAITQYFASISKAISQLDNLSRYHKRADARQRRAIRAFEAAKAKAKAA